MIRQTLVALAALSLATPALAQGAPANPTAAPPASRAAGDEPMANSGPVVERRSERGQAAGEHKISDADIATAPVTEATKSSHHTVTVGGKTIPYTATAGTLTIRDDDGKPVASMFYVAYVAERAKGEAPIHDAASRTQLWIMPTNEELVVARQAKALLEKS